MSLKPRICAVIACYTGDRRWSSPSYQTDRLHYARLNIERIRRNASLIEDIYLVFNGGVTPEMDELRSEGVTLMSRENVGFSYGAWNFALRLLRDKYEFAYLSEDDYVPCAEGFDAALHEYFSSGTVGYVCGLLGSNGHAAVSNGMMSMEAYGKIEDRYGGFQIVPGDDYGSAEGSQSVFPLSLKELDYEVRDSTDRYKTLFNHLYGPQPCIVTFGDPERPTLFEPILD